MQWTRRARYVARRRRLFWCACVRRLELCEEVVLLPIEDGPDDVREGRARLLLSAVQGDRAEERPGAWM